MEKRQPIERFVEDDEEPDEGEHLKMDEESHPIMTKPTSMIGPVISQKWTTICLGVGLALAVFGLVVLAIAFGVTVSTLKSSPSSGGGEGESNICLTESCIQASAFILGNINRSVDPCQDFYNFTCGAWAQKTVIPTGKGSISSFAELAERNTIALKKILDKGEDGGVEAVGKVMDLYQSCLDTKRLNTLGAGPLLQLINKTGGWNLLNMSNDSSWDINDKLFLVEKILGSPAFFTVGVTVDDKNSSNYIIVVSQSGLSLPSRDFYLDNKTASAVQALKTLLVTVFSLLMPDGDSAMYEETALELIAFESRLAEIFLSDVDLRNIDITYNKMRLSELSDLFPVFDWTSHVNALFQLTNHDLTLTDDEPVIVRTPSYLQNLTEVFLSEPTMSLENYAKWQLVKQYLPYLSEDFAKAYSTFTLATQGRGEGERFETCVNVVQEALPIALARPYSQFVLPPGTKSIVSEMIDAVKAAFIERLNENTWLDDTTREASKEKVRAITKMIAFPDQLYNDTYLNHLYADYNVSADDFFANIKRFVVFSTTRNLRHLRQPVDKTEWDIAPTKVNAYYNPPYNQFVFLEGILNLPFFQAGWPDYLKYGALGTVIGHELTHGFDDQGQRYDKDGILQPWWTDQSISAFKDRQRCFAEQYSKYEMFGYNINGNLTLGENIADNGGLKAAFQAYRDTVKRKGMAPPLLPSLTSYTDEQMFFIAFGQVWCSIFTPEYVASLTKSNPHSPGPYRIIGTLVNSEEFSRAFQCSENSFMNPPQKCLMW